MNKRDTVKVIKAMGLSAKWDREWNEYCINYPLYDTRRHGDDSSYHTDDSDDAIATARIMQGYK